MMFSNQKFSYFLKLMYGSSLIIFFLNFLSSVIFARLLEPFEIGKLAFILAVENVLLLLVDFGISSRIIQKDSLENKDISYYFTFTSIIGFLLSVLLLLAMYAGGFLNSNINWFYCSLILILDSMLILPLSLARRNLNFKKISKASYLSTILSTIFSIFYVYIFNSIQGIFLGVILNKAILLLIFKRDIQFVFRLKEILFIIYNDLKDSGLIFLSQMFNLLSAKIDDILVNKFFGSTQLGLYNISWNLMLIPISKINSVINEVSFPYFKNELKKELVKKQYLENLFFCMALGMPILLLLNINTSETVFILYGNKWEASIPFIKVMTLIGLFKLINNPGGAVLLAFQKNRALVFWNLAWLIVVLFIFTLPLYIEIQLLSILNLLLLISFFSAIVFQYIIIRIIDIKLIEYIPHLYIIILSILAYLIASSVEDYFRNIFLQFALKSLIFVLVYISILSFLLRKVKFNV